MEGHEKKAHTMTVLVFGFTIPLIISSLLIVPISAGNPVADARQMEKIVFIDYGKKPHAQNSQSIDLCGDGTNRYTFLGGKIRWQELPVPYYVNSSAFVATDEVTPAQAEAAVVAAFDTWDLADHPKAQFFTQVDNADDAKIIVSWKSMDGASNILGTTAVLFTTDTKEILLSRIDLDSGETWSISAEGIVCENLGPGFDIQNIITHEVGHAVGLGHVTDPALTMYPYASPGETHKKSLGLGDQNGFNRLQ